MSSFVLGDTVINAWTVLDGADAPLTGMTSPADVTIVLHRQSGVVMVAASETVTWIEDVASAGHYSLRFTPLNTGLYVLQIHETNVNTNQRWFTFPAIDVLSAGAVFTPAYANAFCSESDIERWIQYPITATTAPSSTNAAAFAEARAAVLMSICRQRGFTVSPTTVTSGSVLEDLLREANAIGAALDYTIAQQFGKSPSRTDRVELLDLQWFERVYGRYVSGKLVGGGIITEISNLSSFATDHIISGDTLAAPSSGAPTDSGITFGMGTLF